MPTPKGQGKALISRRSEPPRSAFSGMSSKPDFDPIDV
jgi:hypothetical protein